MQAAARELHVLACDDGQQVHDDPGMVGARRRARFRDASHFEKKDLAVLRGHGVDQKGLVGSARGRFSEYGSRARMRKDRGIAPGIDGLDSDASRKDQAERSDLLAHAENVGSFPIVARCGIEAFQHGRDFLFSGAGEQGRSSDEGNVHARPFGMCGRVCAGMVGPADSSIWQENMLFGCFDNIQVGQKAIVCEKARELRAQDC